MNRLLNRSVVLVAVAAVTLLAGCFSIESEPAPPLLDLPIATPTAVTPDMRSYIVLQGDSLVSIAEAQGVSLARILELNDVPNPALIEPGLDLVLPPGPAEIDAAAAATSAARGASTLSSSVTSAPERVWYERWADRLPSLPEQLEPARPVLIAIAVIVVSIIAVTAAALGVPVLHGLLGRAASGLALGGGRLQAAVAGMPALSATRSGGGAVPSFRPTLHWPGRLRPSRAALALGRPPFGEQRSAPSSGRRTPPPHVVSAARDSGGRLPDGPNQEALMQRLAGHEGQSRGVLSRSLHRISVGLRSIGHHAGSALLPSWRGVVLAARTTRKGLHRVSRRAWSKPTGYLRDRQERRRRRRFREQVEADTAARMRLGLRDDTEAYLQRSLDESLIAGWRLEAAWCLRLMAEESDRRGDHALAELRRVRARELIREHAIAHEPSPTDAEST